jgi:hypothetical protein
MIAKYLICVTSSMLLGCSSGSDGLANTNNTHDIRVRTYVAQTLSFTEIVAPAPNRSVGRPWCTQTRHGELMPLLGTCQLRGESEANVQPPR